MHCSQQPQCPAAGRTGMSGWTLQRHQTEEGPASSSPTCFLLFLTDHFCSSCGVLNVSYTMAANSFTWSFSSRSCRENVPLPEQNRSGPKPSGSGRSTHNRDGLPQNHRRRTYLNKVAGSFTTDGVDLTVDDGDDLGQRQADGRQAGQRKPPN